MAGYMLKMIEKYILYLILFSIFLSILFMDSYNNIDKFNNISTNIGIYTAVIVEPRKHEALELVLTNFTNNLDNR